MSIQTFTDPAMYVISRAALKFSDANPNRAPVSPADLESYLEAPLDPATFEDYFAGWKKNPATFGRDRLKNLNPSVFRTIGAAQPAAK